MFIRNSTVLILGIVYYIIASFLSCIYDSYKKDNIWQTDIVYVLSVSPHYFAISLVKTSLYYSHFNSLQKLSFFTSRLPIYCTFRDWNTITHQHITQLKYAATHLSLLAILNLSLLAILTTVSESKKTDTKSVPCIKIMIAKMLFMTK